MELLVRAITFLWSTQWNFSAGRVSEPRFRFLKLFANAEGGPMAEGASFRAAVPPKHTHHAFETKYQKVNQCLGLVIP